MPNLAGNKHLPIHFLLSMEIYGSNRPEMYTKVVIPAPTQKIIAETKIKKGFHDTNFLEIHQKTEKYFQKNIKKDT